MPVKVSLANQHCVIEKRSSFAHKDIKKEINLRKGTYGGFVLINTAIPGANQTFFKVYDNGKDILIAICMLHTYMAQGVDAANGERKDEIEILFDPYHDHMGYVQYLLHPDRDVQTFHHLPYPEFHSTAFPLPRVKKFTCEVASDSKDIFGTRFGPQWLFVQIPATDIFRNGNACGFNIARNWRPGNETTSWNLCSGIGFPDATTFGHLHRKKPTTALKNVTATLAASKLVIKGHLAGSARNSGLSLLDPTGEQVPMTVSENSRDWQAQAHLTRRMAGRYRLVPRATRGGGIAEPECIALDVSLPQRNKPFTLGMTYDIVDDLCSFAYTSEQIKTELQHYANCGVRRIYWIDYPIEWFFDSTLPALRRNARQTHRQCGDPMPVAATLAKQLGMEFIAVFKPFDMGHVIPNQEWLMAQNRAWKKQWRLPIHRLRIYSDVPFPRLKKSDMRVLCSNGNKNYRPYRGKFSMRQGTLQRAHQRWTPAGNVTDEGTAKTWYLELTDLNVNAPYVALDIRNDNTLLRCRAHAMVEAWDMKNRPVPTLPLSFGDVKTGFHFFETWSGWRNRSPAMLEERTWKTGVHGIQFGEIEEPPGLMEPAFDGAREFWLNSVQRVADTDADGIDIRTICHHNCPEDYMTLAFADPVCEAFTAEYGREPTHSWDDCIKIRQLRGDIYTDFLRKARRITTDSGKKFIAHFESGTEIPARYDQRMQLDLQWETWLKEGLLDEITLKWWGSQNTFIHDKIMPHARKQGIPVHICAHNATLASLRAYERAERLVEDAQMAGFSGFFFYESACYTFRTPEGIPDLKGQAKGALETAARTIEA